MSTKALLLSAMSAASPAQAADPSQQLYLQGSAPIVDLSPAARTLTINNVVSDNTVLHNGLPTLKFVHTTIASTSSSITTPSSSAFELGYGDFTVETYIRLGSQGQSHTIFDVRGSDSYSAYGLFINSSRSVYWFDQNNTFFATKSLTSQRWHHVAAVRRNGTLTLYIDGASSGSTSRHIVLNGTGPFRVGVNAGSYVFLNGHLANFSFTKFAKYTANFQPG